MAFRLYLLLSLPKATISTHDHNVSNDFSRTLRLLRRQALTVGLLEKHIQQEGS